MLSKRLQIIITLLFVTMMFVQAPATANASILPLQNGSNTNSKDYQSGSQFLSDKSATHTVGKNNVNNIQSSSSDNSSVITYNPGGNNPGYYSIVNKSYVNPGQNINITVNSSVLSNFNYTNTFGYTLQDPTGNAWFSSSSNTTITNSTPYSTSFSVNMSNQLLNGKISLNSTSSSNLYGVYGNISQVTNQSYGLTSEMITWHSDGYTTSGIIYDTVIGLNSSTVKNKVIDGLNTTHTVYLTNLQPSTQYFYRVYGIDYFGRLINTTKVFNFTSLSINSNYPYLTSPIKIKVYNTTATIESPLSTNLGSDFEYIITPNKTIPNLSKTSTIQSGTPFNMTYGLSSLKPGTQYFFKLIVINHGNPTYNTTYDNGGLYFSFVTLPNTVSVSFGLHPTSYNKTSLQESLVFTTSSQVNASIIYSTDPFFQNSVFVTPFDSSNTTHTFTFNAQAGTKYFYKINITDGQNYYLILTSNNAKPNPYEQNSDTSIDMLSFFTFYTPVLSSQDVNKMKSTFIFQIPTYPAVLGTWQFTMKIYQNDIIQGGPKTQVKSIPVNFIVNDTLIFTLNAINGTYIEHGYTSNETGTYPTWAKSSQNIYSPTDNIILIGKIAYNSSPTNYINNSIMFPSSSYANGVVGTVNLKLNETTINEKLGKTSIYEIPDAKIAPLWANSSFFTNVISSVSYVINVKIPAKDIYGNMSVEMALNFPHTQNWAKSGYYQNSTAEILNVKYRLALINSTGENSYSLTTTGFNGSATILPYQFENLTSLYQHANVTNFISLPGSEINLSLNVLLKGVKQDIFQFTRNNYTWYWFTPNLDSSFKLGTYLLTLHWVGSDGSTRGNITNETQVYDSGAISFSYSFHLTVSFTVEDMTSNITALPDSQVTLRFKIIVPETSVAWDRNLNATAGNQNCQFDPVTGSYSVTISVPSDAKTGSVPVDITYNSTLHGQISYFVSSTPNLSYSSGASMVNTLSVVDIQVSLTDFALLGAAILGTIAYGVFIYLSKKRAI